MRRGGGKDEAPDKAMGPPLFPRLHVNDTVKGGPRAPPRNKMALYEQFSVPSHRVTVTAPPWQSHRPTAAGPGGEATSAVPPTSASQVGGYDRSLFPSFCVPSTEPVRSSDHKTNGTTGNSARAESGRKSTQLKSKDAYAAGPTAECSSRHREHNIHNSSGKKFNNDDDFTVPSFLYSGMPQHSTQEKVRIQEKSAPYPTTSPYKSGSAISTPSSKCSNADRRHLEGMIVSDKKSRESPSMKEKEPAKLMRDLETEERASSFQTSREKLGRMDTNLSSYKDRLSNFNYTDKQHSYQTKSRKENAAEAQNNPPKNATLPSSKPCTGMEHNGSSKLLEHGLREAGEKRKSSHQDVERKGGLSDSSAETLPELEISPDDVAGAIGPKHFWKARRAIVNQQRVFAVQVFELHRLIKVQKLIAASPHLLIEGDPCLGNALVASKKLAGGNMEKQLPSSKNKDGVQPTLQEQEYSKDNTDGNQPSPSQDDVAGVQHDGQGTANGVVSSNPLAMATASENKQGSWCIPPPPNQWLVPVMSPSDGLVYKPYTGPCPPAGSFLAPCYAGCTPVSLPSTAGDFMNSAYGIPMAHQLPHMGAAGPPPMQPMYFPPFSMPVMNPAASAYAVEQASHVAAWPNGQREQHSRSSCNMSHLRSEALSAGIWGFHASRDTEPQGSSASSPLDRQQGEGRGPAPLLAEPSGGNGNRDNTSGVIRVVPHAARTASESAALIFQSIQMERQQSDL